MGISAQSIAAWRAGQVLVNKQIMALEDPINAALATAKTNYYQARANLALNIAIKRIQGDAKAKLAALQSATTSTVGQNVNKVA